MKVARRVRLVVAARRLRRLRQRQAATAMRRRDADTSPPFNACAARSGRRSCARRSSRSTGAARRARPRSMSTSISTTRRSRKGARSEGHGRARDHGASPSSPSAGSTSTMDAMHVQRVDIQTEASCWDHALRATVDAGARDDGARSSPRPAPATAQRGRWSTSRARRSRSTTSRRCIARSCSRWSTHPIPAANVAPGRGRARAPRGFRRHVRRRAISIATSCASAVTTASTRSPTTTIRRLDRFWPVPGLPEKAVYGAFDRHRRRRAHTAFRVDSFVDGGNEPAVGLDDARAAGSPSTVADRDPAGVDGKLASVTGTQHDRVRPRGGARSAASTRCAASCRRSTATARSPIPTPRSRGSSR